tara:strand:- start:968 stop:1348 length:381 start_codon:yes stop_codon:yes gene_type:complete
MNTLEQFLKEQKEVERYGQYQDMVKEMVEVRKENKELKHLDTILNDHIDELTQKCKKEIDMSARLLKENVELKEEVKRLIGGTNMMNDNINNTLHHLIEVYNKCVTHHKEINKRYGSEIILKQYKR